MSGADKGRILAEIKRTAAENDGVPLGQARFLQETGIRVADWHGRYWARWGDALQEAGFQPNQMQAAYADNLLILRLIDLIRQLGHFPVRGELKLQTRHDPTFPSHNVFARLGSKQQLAAKVLAYSQNHSGFDDVVTLCAPIASRSERRPIESDTEPATSLADGVKAGYVYMALLKIGREKRYKIGKAVLVERRTDQISIQLPEDLELIHTISTDDAYGIEDYWHRRFAAKNTKGEWFSLSLDDVKAFRRRKFM